ncbi:hypothetical protein LX32DRAFT_714679 [Colletotrichum zoysiae]|uniref:Uncharacterized protein n=1 Tax=Colletotrichum zoysiae TaxID=1216348 RepID=A0AAD9LWJ2_9PEZI|nr:hypothetical protein LX32DRAFT_714679 [Colletotrichum zoysiae]
MLRNSVLLLLSLLWITITHGRDLRPALSRPSVPQPARGRVQYCSRATCGIGKKAVLCRRQQSPKALSAPKPSSQPANGYWYSPSNYGNNFDNFFRGEVAKLVTTPNGIVRIDKEDVSSQIASFKDKPTSLALLGLYGCIGVIVMSRQAVWMAHMYEKEVIKSQENFPKGVALLLSGGNNEDMLYGLWDLNDNVFAREQDPVVVIVGPGSTKTSFDYKDQMDIIDLMIRRTLGVAPEWVSYVPEEGGSPEYKADFNCLRSRGKVLVQYQPSNQAWYGRSKAEARIWIEGKSWTYQKQWQPESDQIHN